MPGRRIAALHRCVARDGADVRAGTAMCSMHVGVDVVTVETDAGSMDAEVVVLAAGPWLRSLVFGAMGGEPSSTAGLPNLRVTQEQPSYFSPLQKDLPWPSFVHHRRPEGSPTSRLAVGHYGLLTPGVGVKVGASHVGPVVDPSARVPISDDATRRLEAYVEEWLPGLAPMAVRTDSCLYTSTPDERFVVRRRRRVVVCSACSGHGFKFAPAMGRMVAQFVTDPQHAPLQL